MPGDILAVALRAQLDNWLTTRLVTTLDRTHPATEVYVTGTFDDWKKSQKLEKVGDGFEKKVALPDASHKILYKVRRSSCHVCI